MPNPRGNRDSEVQFEEFRKAARELGCDEDESRFDAALGKIARHKPQPAPTKPQKEPKIKKPPK